MTRDGGKLYFSFWAILASCTFTTLKTKIKQKWKKVPGGVIILHMCTENYDHMMYGFLVLVTSVRTGVRKKWHIEAGAHLKIGINVIYHLLVYNFVSTNV